MYACILDWPSISVTLELPLVTTIWVNSNLRYFYHTNTVAIISSFVYVIFYSIIKRDIPDTNTGYKLNIY